MALANQRRSSQGGKFEHCLLSLRIARLVLRKARFFFFFSERGEQEEDG